MVAVFTPSPLEEPYNRTMLELKFGKGFGVWSEKVSYNRTMLELK